MPDTQDPHQATANGAAIERTQETGPNSPTASTPTPSAPEPAFLTRARRILGGEIHPEDYLPVTPEIQAAVERDMAFAHQHCKGKGFEPAPEVMTRQIREWLLVQHHGGQNLAIFENDRGIIVLAAGLDQVGSLVDRIPYEMRQDVVHTCPEREDW